MEQKIEKSFSKKNQDSAESSWDMSEDENVKKIVNSWDSNSSKNENPKEKPYNSDWDSDSDCKETLVMPFNKEHFSDSPWDSESKEFNEKKFKIVKATEKVVEQTSSLESLSIKSNLIVEDIEEILDENISQDNTVWKIPSSARTDTDELDSLDEKNFHLAKSKSFPGVEAKAKLMRIGHSKSEGELGESIVLDMLHPHEGKHLRKSEKVSKKISKSLLDVLTSPQGNYYREYECRPVIPMSDEDVAKVCVVSYERPNEEVKEDKVEGAEPVPLPYLTDEPSTSYDSNPPSSNRSVESTKFKSCSLPIRKSEKFGKKKFVRKAVNCKYQEKPGSKNDRKLSSLSGKSKGAIPKAKRDCKIKERPVTESWIFLDESGFSQQVTKTEVNILLNGKSADAVLQEQTGSLLPKKSIIRNASSELITSDWTPVVQKNIQNLIGQEDVGEEASGKSIGLERKLGNMLLYIRSRVDLEASVRFISVDTNMINLWRQSKDFTESVPESNPENSTIELQTIILQNSKTIESLAVDLKKIQSKLEDEKQRNAELEKELAYLRGVNAKLSITETAENSPGRLSEHVIECETFQYSSTPREVASPSTKSRHEDKLPKFIGIDRNVDEKPCSKRKSATTVNLYSVNNEESESVASNDDLQTLADEKLNKTEGYYGDGFDPGTNPENGSGAKLRSRSTSCYEEDSETESLQSNTEHKSKSEWFDSIKDLLDEVEESKRKLREHGYELDYESEEDGANPDLNFVRSYLKDLTEHMIKHKTSSSREINPDEYYRMISEKAALTQENRNLKAENNLLLESQIEQYEKLKRVEKSSIELISQNLALENDKKFLESEKEELLSKIKRYEDEKKDLENKISEKEDVLNKEIKKSKKLEDVVAKKEGEIKKVNEQLGVLCGKFENFEVAQKSKDETINRLKTDKKELAKKDSLNICAIEFLTEKVKSIEAEKLNLAKQKKHRKIPKFIQSLFHRS